MTRGFTAQKGFTLLEILIALVVLSVGLLGIAGMQATGLRNNHAAYTKTQATAFAMDMADRIRANPQGAANYHGLDTNNPNTVPDAPGCTNPGCTPVPNCIASGCTSAELAEFDKYQWSQPLLSTTAPALPQGRGIISYDATNNLFTIGLLWLEPNYNGVEHTQCVTGQASDIACFQLTFQP